MQLQKIRKWFYNHYSRPERQYVKFIRRWSARNAFYHMCRDEVTIEAKALSGALPGSQAYLGALQDATTKLWRQLSDREQQIYIKLAKRWSDEPPPPHIQARYVSWLPFMLCGAHNIITVPEWLALLVPKLSVTFNSNYSNLVGSDASSSLHMKMKRTQLSLACKSSENLVRQIDVLFNHIDVKLISQMIRRNHLFLFAPTGRMLRFSGNGRNTLKESTKQVWCYLIAKYMWRINEPDTVKTGMKSRSKTDTTPITISLNSYGCPKVPKVTPNRSCPPKTKTVQIMLREYLKAHIRKSSSDYFHICVMLGVIYAY